MNSNQKLDVSLKKLENSFVKSDKYLKEYINVKKHRNSILIKELEEVVSQISYELLERKKKMQPLFPSNIRQLQVQNNMSQRQVNQKTASQMAAQQKAGVAKVASEKGASAPQKVAPQKAARGREMVNQDFKNTIVQAPRLDYYDLEWKIPHTENWINREREFAQNPNQMYIYKFYRKELPIEYYDLYDYNVSNILQKLLNSDEKYMNMEMIRSTMDWLFPVYNNTNDFKAKLNINFNINQFPKLSPKEDEKLYMDYECMYRYFFALQIYLLNFGFRIYEDKFFNSINVKLKSNEIDLADYNYFIYIKDSNYHINKVIIYLFARIAISLKLMQLDYLIPTWRECLLSIKTKITEMRYQNDPKYIKIINAIELLVDMLYRITITVMGPTQRLPFSFKISDSNNDFFVVQKIK